MSIDSSQLRRAMGQFATGVTILTTEFDGEARAMTANAIASVSLQPPLVLVCIDRLARTHALVAASGVFAVNVLNEDQESLARLMAGGGDEETRQLKGIHFEVAATGAPILPGVLSYLDCRVVAAYPGGDHTIFLAEVVASGTHHGRPLLYYRGRYTRAEEESGGLIQKAS